MVAVTFDTHAYVKKLTGKGISEQQAETIVEMVKDVQEQNASTLATKGDIDGLKAELRELELRLKLQIGTMIFALGGVLIAIKYLGHG